MGVFDLFGKKPVSSEFQYSLECSVHPIRLPAFKEDYVLLNVSLQNTSDQPLLTSLVLVVPKTIGFDRTALQQEHETRVGEMQPGERKGFPFKIWSTSRTRAGSYPLRVYAVSHYRDYGHILNEVRRTIDLRVE
ncbi:hypothetical protein COT29_03820 [Candidatus Micrarchaeota archaeon CG08_land_8_20_14_0_20_59_11]|nr:MAG: hypothetical protein COT29_03820 [Candidatus Micrarchaeota archaeon CG08_land_8_20_14_0_20_59_11]